MIRKLNATGRVRIPQSGMRFSMAKIGKRRMRVDLSASIPEEVSSSAARKRVLLDLRQGTAFRRETVELEAGASQVSISIDCEFDGDPEGAVGTLRIIDKASHKVLAEAKRLRPARAGEARSTSILPLISADLDGEVWRLDFESTDGGPRLLIERELGHPGEVARYPAFLALVLAEVLRRILTAVIQSGDEPSGEEDDWRSQWMNLAEKFAERPAGRIARDDANDWIDLVARRFARSHRAVDRMRSIFEIDE